MTDDEKNKDEKDKDVDEEIRRSRTERDAARRSMRQAERHAASRDMMRRAMKKEWRHPINVAVYGWYHKCATCNGKIGDEVVVVVERKRSGDLTHVFCGRECMTNYVGW